MSKKNYEAVVSAVSRRLTLYGSGNADYQRGFQDMIIVLADVFGEDNPRFDRGRFLNKILEQFNRGGVKEE